MLRKVLLVSLVAVIAEGAGSIAMPSLSPHVLLLKAGPDILEVRPSRVGIKTSPSVDAVPAGEITLFSSLKHSLEANYIGKAYPKGKYWCCSAEVVGYGQDHRYAEAFTPKGDAVVNQIGLAASWLDGTNSVIVALAKDAGGVPGKEIVHFSLSNLPPLGTCCLTETADTGAIPIHGGQQYWIVLRVPAGSDTSAGWNSADLDQINYIPQAYGSGGSWQRGGDIPGMAFAVFGKYQRMAERHDLAKSAAPTVRTVPTRSVFRSKLGRIAIASGAADFNRKPAMPRADLSPISDNFAEAYPNGTYWCCQGYSIDSGYWLATDFTPAQNAVVQQIALAVSHFDGSNEGVVTLNEDAGGIPGAKLAEVRAKNLPEFGNCCDPLVVNLPDGVPVLAGSHYWVVVRTAKNAEDAKLDWNLNDTDQIDSAAYATYYDGQWHAGNNPLFFGFGAAVYGTFQ